MKRSQILSVCCKIYGAITKSGQPKSPPEGALHVEHKDNALFLASSTSACALWRDLDGEENFICGFFFIISISDKV